MSIKIGLVNGELAALTTDVLVYGATEDELKKGKPASDGLRALDAALGGVLAQAIASAEFEAKANSELSLHTHGKLAAPRLVVLGLGAADKLDREAARLAAARAVKAAERAKAPRAALVFPFDGRTPFIESAAEGAQLGAYKFDKYLSEAKPRRNTRLDLVLPKAATKAEKQAVTLGTALGESVNLARDLVNEPANAINPTTLAATATDVARKGGLKIEVLEKKDIQKLKMGMFLGVAQGSEAPPKLVHLWWEPAGKARGKGVAIVGKAITFDSGGLSLKPPSGMETMKCDMGGSAAVIGTMKMIAALKPSFPVHAFLGACENMPSGTAQRPGDIVRARNGKTVEVLNTDAEGRLVLGDVLTWAAEHKVEEIVDLATLTGAIMVALGPWMTGLFSPNDELANKLLEAANGAGEEMWRMPMPDNLKELLKSPVADMKNVGGRSGGSITAALFLREFVGNVPWAHLDIASSAFSEKEKGYDPKGGTGAGVRTLVEWIRNRK